MLLASPSRSMFRKWSKSGDRLIVSAFEQVADVLCWWLARLPDVGPYFAVAILGTGAIVGVAKVDPMPRAAGKWTSFDITVEGPHMVVLMDGVKTADASDSRYVDGPIALQYGGGVIKFRKVLIKEL